MKTVRRGNKHKNWKGVGDIGRRYWRNVEHHAKIRNIPLEVSMEQAWLKFEEQSGTCALSGIKLIFGSRNGRGNYTETTASLDRVNSNDSYNLNNIQWVHKDINLMKGKLTEDRFKELCKHVSNCNTILG